VAEGSYNDLSKCKKDAMHSNWQKEFTLVARLVKGQDADGRALAQALFNQIEEQIVVN